MILRSLFLFSFEASYRFLTSTCYFAYLDGFSAEKVIVDLLSKLKNLKLSLQVNKMSLESLKSRFKPSRSDLSTKKLS